MHVRLSVLCVYVCVWGGGGLWVFFFCVWGLYKDSMHDNVFYYSVP